MKIRKFIMISMLLAAIFYLPDRSATYGQQPCPTGNPCNNLPPINAPSGTIPAVPAPTPASLTFADYMQELTLYAVALRQSFIRTVEGTLGEYFLTLAYWLSFIIFLTYFIKSAYRGAWSFSEIWRHTLTFAICLLLLIFCGDPNGDGVNGDLVNIFSDAGNAVAYGSTSGNSYIGELVAYEQDTFDLNYKNFVDNKFMVRVGGADMPVKYPGEESVTVLAAIYTGKPIDNPELKTKAETTEWQMGALFQLLNVGRGFLQFVDFFLLWLGGFLILTARLIAPFMVAVGIDPDLRKRMSLNFAWSLVVVTVIFPVLAQIFRYLGYAAGNLGLGVNPTNPYFSWDATTSVLVVNGEPQIIIILAAMLMFFAGFLLLFSLGIAFKLMQGQILEGISSGVSAAFTTLTSIGFGAAVSGYATRQQTQSDRTGIEGTYDGAVVTADANRQAATVSANTAREVAVISAGAAYDSKLTEALAKNVAAKQSAFGSAASGLINVQAEQYQSVNGALANLRQNLGNLSLDEKKSYADNLVELLGKNDDATSKRIAEVIRQEPEKLDLLAEQYDNILKGVPIGGSVASALGVNKDALNSWMRTEGFKSAGQWLFGNPETGQGGVLNNGAATSKMFEQNRQLGSGFYGNNGGALVYNRPDGTSVDALTGQRLSNNVIDMTDPKNPVDYGNSQSVGNVFSNTGKSGSNTGNITSSSGSGMTKTQQQNFSRMQKLFKSDPNFLPTLQKMNQRNGWDTNQMLNLFALETAGTFDPAVRGGAGSNYVGLIQFGKEARQQVGLPADVGQAQNFLRSLTATQQLPYVEKYLRGVERATGSKLNNFGSLYAAVGGGSGNYQNALNNGGTVFSSTSPNAKNRAGYNANAKSWDYNNDGRITIGEYGTTSFNKLGGGAYFDANNMLGQIRKVDPPTAKLLAKQYSADFELQSSYRNNQAVTDGKNQAVQFYYQGKQQVNENFKDDQIGIANTVAGIKTQGIQTQYNYSLAAADTGFKGEQDAATIVRTGSLQAAGVQHEGSFKVADINFGREMKVADITKQAAIKASYERALGNAISNVGGNVVNQFSQAVEKFNRF